MLSNTTYREVLDFNPCRTLTHQQSQVCALSFAQIPTCLLDLCSHVFVAGYICIRAQLRRPYPARGVLCGAVHVLSRLRGAAGGQVLRE